MSYIHHHSINIWMNTVVIEFSPVSKSSARVRIRSVSLENNHSALWLILYTTLPIGVSKCFLTVTETVMVVTTAQSATICKRWDHFMSVGPTNYHKQCKVLGPDTVLSPLALFLSPIPVLIFSIACITIWHFKPICVSVFPSRSSVRAGNYAPIFQNPK